MLNARKPPGWTSHDVVARLRRLSGQRRVGHAGTLDPLAEGVLPVLFGRATRLAEFVQAGRKRYYAEVQLGTATATDDAEGDVVARRPAPPLDPAGLEPVLERFRGEIPQLPPRYSARKLQGQRAYALARRGATVELEPRLVTVHALELLWAQADVLALDVVCSRGTYLRALARDLAQALGTVGHLRRLLRTAVGPFRLEEALTLDEVAERGLARALLPPDAAVPDAPCFRADPATLGQLAHGRSVPAAGLRAELVRVYDERGRLWLLAAADGQLLRPRISLVADPG